MLQNYVPLAKTGLQIWKDHLILDRNKFKLFKQMKKSVHICYHIYYDYWLLKQAHLKNCKKFFPFWKSEFLLQSTQRNMSFTLHTPLIYNLVFKLHLISLKAYKAWQQATNSILLIGFFTGRCGFKPNETKSFIAGDTLIRAGLWFIKRFTKKLSPVHVRFSGFMDKYKRFFNRFYPLPGKVLKYKYYSFSDVTPPVYYDGYSNPLKNPGRKRLRYNPSPYYFNANLLQQQKRLFSTFNGFN